MNTPGKRIAIICKYCGSDEISRDAWGKWDACAQEWVLGAIYDSAHCHRCDGETSLIEVELASPA